MASAVQEAEGGILLIGAYMRILQPGGRSIAFWLALVRVTYRQENLIKLYVSDAVRSRRWRHIMAASTPFKEQICEKENF